MRLSTVMAAILMTALAACNQTTASVAEASPGLDLRAAVTRKATEHGVPPKLAHGIVRVESNYNCRANNPRSSAKGPMQILKRTAAGVGVTGNLNNCETSLEAGMRYLKEAYLAANGDWCKTATLYNRGVGARATRSPYCRKVLAAAS